MPVEHWALSRVYSIWLDDLRGRREPMAQTRADEDLLRLRLTEWGRDDLEAPELAGFLAALPPQQRAAILLVHGEGLTYEEAAAVLDTPAETVSSRVSRALAGLVERLGLQRPETPVSAEVAMLYPEQEQATS
jgi:RNA polymerase sigma-70 factor (ECF subfamily)